MPAQNRLAAETSPYLLQHAHNPVDWYPWGSEALDRARTEDKPIFLSIGYAACHWCHVMERESFEDPVTAAELARDFIAIKVDREERPDLDQVYMAAVQAMTGQGGWPMSVFLTPDGRPFYGGTYFPAAPRGELPAFRQVLAAVAHAWREQRASVEASGDRLVGALADGLRADAGSAAPGTSAPLPAGAAATAVATLAGSLDRGNGGWGRAPKFPQPMTIEFLLRYRLSVGGAADPAALAMIRMTLDRMAAGGLRDQLGGGFHRYSTDAVWLAPHFEQMLYDNAQLGRAYLHAWQLLGDERDRAVGCGVFDAIVRDFTTAEGGFAASRDADTNGVEGATFTWTPAEVAAALPGSPDVALVQAAWDVTEAGNWHEAHGRTILRRVRTDAELAGTFGLADDEVAARLERARAALLAARDRRPQPNRDDKVLAGWNGLAIAALSEAAAALEAAGDGVRAARYLAAATRAAEVCVDGLLDTGGRLGRSWKDGRATGSGVLEDYACLAEGLLALYQASFDERWFGVARSLADAILERFVDPAGGFFDTASDHEVLITRPRDLQDNAVPSGNAMAVTVLLRLAALTGSARYREAAETALRLVADVAPRHPTFFGQWLLALDFALAQVDEVAIVGDPGQPATVDLLRVVRTGFRPHQVVALSADPATSPIELLADRALVGGQPAAYVCHRFTCLLPVTDPRVLAGLLDESAGTTLG
ncbi:MAG TPA: thioredoxin domain-containing protein [Candidatus Limnocylindrales bacterium]|nr:thioredoxin domain-containing protein [Candidatus Limnocylindrales bacterium]